MPYYNPAPPTNPGTGNPMGSQGGPSAFLQQAQASWAANPNNPANAAATPGVGDAPAPGATPAPPAFPNSNPVMENPSMSQYGFLDPNAWQNWAGFGGSNPQNWQQLGGPVNSQQFGFLNQGNWTQGGSDPTQVQGTTAESLMGAAQPYSDAAYQAATRQLDPQIEAQNAAFDQEMVNKGIAPGSEAYNQAKSQMQMSQNDAYAQARNQAMQQGLGAQAQGFGQGLSQSTLSNQLAQALIGANTSTTNQILGGNQNIAGQMLQGNNSLFNQLIGGNTSLASALLGAQASMQNANAASNASHYATDMSHDLGQQNIDNSMLWNLINGGAGVTSYNNGANQQAFNNSMQFWQGGQLPGGGTGNIDVQSPYNNQYNGQMNQWNYQNQQADQQNQAYMQMISALWGCARELKTTLGPLSPKKALQAIVSLPVDRWQYKEGGEIHIGTYAEEFNAAMELPAKPQIAAIDMLGACLSAIQELASEVREIKQRLAA